MRLEITLKAQNDVYNLQEFGNVNFGVLHTRKYLISLTETFKTLRARPELARLREEYDGQIRVHPHRSHMIFYRIEDDAVKILRIISRHQDWPSKL